VRERHRRRRARAALVGVALLVVSAPSSASLHPPVAEPRATVGSEQVAVPVARRAPKATTTPPTAEVVDDIPIQPPPVTFDAPASEPAAPPDVLHAAATTSSSTRGGVWAVIIGIDDYPGRGSDLHASVADADDVDAALAGYGVPADHRLVLRDTQATAAVVVDAARWLVGRTDPDSTAVFFYAGHVRSLGNGREAIVGADGELVADVDLADVLRPLAASQTWIAMASCFAGGFDELLAPGRILTAAAPAGRLAYESADLGNSYLVEYMVDRAMRAGQAPGSIEQSFAWAVDALRREHPKRVPVQYDRLDGELRLGVTTPAPAPAAPQPAPPPPPPSSPPAPSDDPPDDDACLVTIGSIVGCDDQATGI
jgi:hypothetical protein